MLANTLAFQRELTLKRQNEALLEIAQELFTNLGKEEEYTDERKEVSEFSADVQVPFVLCIF